MLIRTDVSNIGDPFILSEENGYYMYCTDFDVEGFKVRKSSDLKHWEICGMALDLSNSCWYKSFWAPEVISHNGIYIMHFSSRLKSDDTLCIGVAIADKPEGPFKDVYNGPMFDFGYPCIDAHCFIDDDGQAYLFYSKDCSGNAVNGVRTSQIWAVSLSSDLLSTVGEPVLITTPDRPYDTIDHKNCVWNEGPAVLKKNGRYYLTYSANFFASKEYAICLAVSDSILGPYVKDDVHNPVLKALPAGSDFAGPGHNCLFYDNKGKLKSAFHIQSDENHPGQWRKACIMDIETENGTLRFTE